VGVNFSKDVDAALALAKKENKPLLIDFSAAPAWGACARLEAESYADPELSAFVNQNFISVSVNIKEQPALFKRFDAAWTPTAIFFDADGKERYRAEGYLPRSEFAAEVGLSLGRIAFMHKQWEEAVKRYEEVVLKFPLTRGAAEALYWAGISRYRTTKDHAALSALAQEFTRKYQDSIWAVKASVWLWIRSQLMVAGRGSLGRS
jgi:uncharacterized protein YyaL (SSP411 family)